MSSEPHLARFVAAIAISLAALLGAGCSRRDAAPQFDYTLLDGSSAHSQALHGQVWIVNFWATSCAICVSEMPQLVATQQRFAARGMQTLAVAMRHDAPARVAAFAEQRQLPFQVVIDNTGDIARRFGDVQQTPTTFVVDRQGRVARRIVGAPDFAALDALVVQLLAES